MLPGMARWMGGKLCNHRPEGQVNYVDSGDFHLEATGNHLMQGGGGL